MKRSVTATKAPGHVKRDIGTYLVEFLNYGERYLVILVLVFFFCPMCWDNAMVYICSEFLIIFFEVY